MTDADLWNLTGSAAEQYERIPGRYLIGPWAPGLVEAARIRSDDRILDIACGTGVVTRIAARKLGPSGHITGLDLNEGMLEVAKTIGNPGCGTIDWIQNSAIEIELPDDSFDVILCQQGLQFFPDPRKALREAHRVLRVSGRSYFSVWRGSGPYNVAVGGALSTHIDDETSRRYLAARDVPDGNALQSMFNDTGFRQVSVSPIEMDVRIPEIERFVLAHLRGTPVSGAVDALSETEQIALVGDVVGDLADFADGADVVVPDSINLVSARK